MTDKTTEQIARTLNIHSDMLTLVGTRLRELIDAHTADAGALQTAVKKQGEVMLELAENMIAVAFLIEKLTASLNDHEREAILDHTANLDPEVVTIVQRLLGEREEMKTQ